MTIKDIRASTGLSQSKFCEALNIPLPTLQKWERGARSCPDYVIELIAYKVKTDPQFVVAEAIEAERKRGLELLERTKETIGRNRDKYVRKELQEQIGNSVAVNYSAGDMKKKMLENFGADCEFLTLSNDKE